MQKTTEDQARGISWTPCSNLEDPDFLDDLALPETLTQEKTARQQSYGQQVGLVISCNKTKVIPININTPEAIVAYKLTYHRKHP